MRIKGLTIQLPILTPLPTSTRNPGSPGALPGFDARRNALSGPDVRVIRSKRPDGKIVARDLADGNVSKTDPFTLSFEHDFGNGFSISDKARFSRIRTIAHDFRGGPDSGLRNAEDFVADQLAKLQAAFPTVRSTRLVRVNDGRVIANPSTLNGNDLLAIHDLIEYDRQTDNFINDFRRTDCLARVSSDLFACPRQAKKAWIDLCKDFFAGS